MEFSFEYLGLPDRLIYHSAESKKEPDKMTTEEIEVKAGSHSHDIKIESLRTPADADAYLQNQEEVILNEVKNYEHIVYGNVRSLYHNVIDKIGGGQTTLREAVHRFHEDVSNNLIYSQHNLFCEKLSRVRKGKVKKWGEAEIALATEKQRQLLSNKQTLDLTIRDNMERSKKLEKLLNDLRSSGKLGRWSKHTGYGEYKRLKQNNPYQVEKMSKIRDEIRTAETETKQHLKAYDTHQKEKYREYSLNEKKFKDYLFSLPGLSSDEDLQSKFDEYLAEDQRNGDLYKSTILDRIQNVPIISSEKEILKELYEKFVTAKDQEMRKTIDARDISQEVPNVSPELLLKLPLGQKIKIEYSQLSSINRTGGGKGNGEYTKVIEDAYLSKNNKTDTIRIEINKSDVANEKQLELTSKDKKNNLKFRPIRRSLKIDLGLKRITQTVLYNDEKGKPTEFTDETNLDFSPDNKAFKFINISASVSKKLLNP